jgi:glycosyltransferase involved in cell wall biosynthesis
LHISLSERKKNPYLVEVVNDPKTVINNRVANALNLFIFNKILKNANGISYVTENYLQKIYSPNKRRNNIDLIETYYSSVEIHKNDILSPRVISSNLESLKLIHIANTMFDNLKGQVTVIKLVKKLIDNNYSVNCVFIGEGDSINYYRKLVNDFSLQENIRFVGRINNRMVLNEYIDNSDIFVYPTHMEGLPRVLIEAMSRGIPVLSSPVSGIPELLNQEYLVNPDDVETFYNKITMLMLDYSKLNEMSSNNIRKSYNYTNDVLSKRRSYFYNHLKKIINQKKECL